jgi:hypothetical protein
MEKREVVEAKGVRRYLSGIIKKSRFILRMSPASGKIELTHIPAEAVVICPQDIPDLINNPEVVDRQVLISVYHATKGRIELEGIALQGG